MWLHDHNILKLWYYIQFPKKTFFTPPYFDSISGNSFLQIIADPRYPTRGVWHPPSSMTGEMPTNYQQNNQPTKYRALQVSLFDSEGKSGVWQFDFLNKKKKQKNFEVTLELILKVKKKSHKKSQF